MKRKEYMIRYVYRLSSGIDGVDKVFETKWYKNLKDAYEEFYAFERTVDVVEGKYKSFCREV